MAWFARRSPDVPDGLLTALKLLQHRVDALEAAWEDTQRRLANTLRSIAQRETELYKRELALQDQRGNGGGVQPGVGGVRASRGFLGRGR